MGDSKVTIIIPVHNEEENVQIVAQAIAKLRPQTDMRLEMLFVNDGSTDGTAAKIGELIDSDPEVDMISLSRNFGKESALTAGIDAANGDAVIPFDADLQDPPHVILAMLEKWREGYQVVLGHREERSSDPFWKRMTAEAFYRVINFASPLNLPRHVGDFRLLDRQVVIAIRRMRERSRFMKGLFAWVGYRTTSVSYTRPARAHGETKWSFLQLWSFAWRGIFAFSNAPLRLVAYTGVIVCIAAMVYGLWLLLRTLVWGIDLPGYASTMVVMLLLGGLQTLAVGVIGHYLGLVYDEIKQRPIYLIEESATEGK